MNKKRIIIIIAAVAVIGLAVWGIMAFKGRQASQDTNSGAVSNFDAVTSFTVEKPNFVIKGRDLSRIDVYGVPTGTNVTETDIKSLGKPVLKSTDAGIQTWTLEIPKSPMLLTDIYVIGYDKNDKPAGSLSLGITGATVINDALWGKGTPATGGIETSTSNPLRTLKAGGSASFGGLRITLTSITEDSRCPKGVNCIQAGRVAALLSLTANGKTATQQIDSTKAITWSGYTISIESVSPLPVQGEKDFSKYEITFRIKQG